jgi:hypothetical protein
MYQNNKQKCKQKHDIATRAKTIETQWETKQKKKKKTVEYSDTSANEDNSLRNHIR